jgi:hypothetical protein
MGSVGEWDFLEKQQMIHDNRRMEKSAHEDLHNS